MTDKNSAICQQCGMIVSPCHAYHPYAACMMFKASHSGKEVTANLQDVVEYGAKNYFKSLDPPARLKIARELAKGLEWVLAPRISFLEYVELIRLSREYTGAEELPPIDGWSWWDATRKLLGLAGLSPVEIETVRRVRQGETDTIRQATPQGGNDD